MNFTSKNISIISNLFNFTFEDVQLIQNIYLKKCKAFN